MKHTIGIAEIKVTDQPGDILITYSLGSCMGLTLYDPVAGVGGMIHCMLPLSKIDAVKAEAKPGMFVDTGVVHLLKEVFDLGAKKATLEAKVAGCAQLLDEKKLFNIGERNYVLVRKVLWKNDILIAGEDVKGTVSRTLTLYMDSGRTTVKIKGKEKEL